jgi:UDP-glucose 4-epimerase
MRALVTGGAGFVGHHLVAALLERGDSVSVLDDFSTGHRSRILPFLSAVRLIEGSVLDPLAIAEAVESCESVFHLAAIPSVARSLVDPRTSHDVNVTGSVNVMLGAAKAGVRRVIYAGSSSVYGVPESLPCRESMLPAPESPYGVSKLAGEYYVHVLGKSLGVETVSLRYFNVFGPGQDPASEYAAVVPRFITAVLAGGRPTINGDPTISRDFTHVANVVSANLLAADAAHLTGVTCNVACGGRTTLATLLERICDAVGRRVEPILGPPRRGDIIHSTADISAAASRLGYRVVVPFSEGIADTVAWYQRALPGKTGPTGGGPQPQGSQRRDRTPSPTPPRRTRS